MTLAAVLPFPVSAPAEGTPRRLLTVRPAPRREPPFDDERDPSAPSLGAHDRPLPFAVHSPAPQPIAVRRRWDEELPDPVVWGRRLVIGMVEAAAGKRPLHQLGGFLTPAIAQGLRAEFLRTERHGRRHLLHAGQPRSVRAMQPCRGVAEISATVQVGQRVRALAMRVERQHDQWRCTRIQLG